MDKLGVDNGSFPRTDRHFCNDINKMKDIDFRGLSFTQIILDYYWAQESYYNDRIHDSFFSDSLPILHGVLQVGGNILLPAQKAFLAKLLVHRDKWQNLFSIGVVTSQNLETVPLYKGTMVLDKEILDTGATEYGKKSPNQEKGIILNKHILLQYDNPKVLKNDLVKFWGEITNGVNENDVKLIELIKK